jgi:hypothetical protein
MAREEMLHLAEQAGFVFKGRVVGKSPQRAAQASGEESALTVEVEEVLRSTEALRGLKGSEVIVIGANAGEGERESSRVWFTNVIALRAQAVLREVGQVAASQGREKEVEEVLRALEERPLRQHLAAANAVIHGKVLSSQRAEEPSIRRSEHDPEWWIARVQVLATLKGKVNGEIDVLFPNSTDIAWYKAPKLYEGVEGILVLWRGKVTEALPERLRNEYQVTEALDFIPLERLNEVRGLLGTQKGAR